MLGPGGGVLSLNFYRLRAMAMEFQTKFAQKT